MRSSRHPTRSCRATTLAAIALFAAGCAGSDADSAPAAAAPSSTQTELPVATESPAETAAPATEPPVEPDPPATEQPVETDPGPLSGNFSAADCQLNEPIDGDFQISDGTLTLDFGTDPAAAGVTGVALETVPLETAYDSRGFSHLFAGRIESADFPSSNLEFPLTSSGPGSIDVAMSLILSTEAGGNCDAPLVARYAFESDFDMAASVVLPAGVSFEPDRYDWFEVPELSAASIWYALSSNDPYQEVAGWEDGTINMYEAETLRVALYGDAEEIHWKVMAEVLEVVRAVAPDTDARFATTHDEVTIPIFIQKCEDWQRNSQGQGGITGSDCNSDGLGGAFAGTYIFLDSSGGNLPTLRHEFGHLLGLKHPKCAETMMTVPDNQASQFGPTDLAGFAVHASSQTTNGMNAEQAAQALGVSTQGDFLAIEQQRDLACASPGGDFEKLASEYLAVAQSNLQ